MTAKTTFNKSVSSLKIYVTIDEGKYCFTPGVYKKITLGRQLIRTGNEHAEYLNNIIELYGVENVELDSGF